LLERLSNAVRSVFIDSHIRNLAAARGQAKQHEEEASRYETPSHT